MKFKVPKGKEELVEVSFLLVKETCKKKGCYQRALMGCWPKLL